MTGRAVHDRHLPCVWNSFLYTSVRWPLWGSVVNSRKAGEHLLLLNSLSLPFPTFPFLWDLKVCILSEGEMHSKVNSSRRGHKCFCPSCAGSDLIRCHVAPRKYGTWLRFIGPSHSWISHSTSLFTPNLCFLSIVKNFNYLWPQLSLCFYQQRNSIVPFLLFSLFSESLQFLLK